MYRNRSFNNIIQEKGFLVNGVNNPDCNQPAHLCRLVIVLAVYIITNGL